MTPAGLFLSALPQQGDRPWRDAWLAKRVTVADQYTLSSNLLSDVRALFLTMHQDQRWLARHADLLERFMVGGGTLVVQGQVAYPFIGGLSCFQPAEDLKLADYTIELSQAHPIFERIDPSTLNRRHGVAGFYARGSHPPPMNAQVLSTMAGGSVPVDWVAARGQGRLFVHSGNDLWTTFAEPAANVDFTRRLVAWALDEEVAG
jgi:hypothetical protein